jgi:hypothetical protein
LQSGVGGLELGGGDHVLPAVVVLERRPVEPAQLVVQDPGEAQRHGGLAGGEGRGQREGGPLGVGVEGGRRALALAALLDPRLADLQLDGVEHHDVGRFDHRHRDVHAAGERGGREVGGQRQLVARGEDGAGQAVRVGLVGHRRRLPAAAGALRGDG